jgi:hypothetical protein
MRFIGVKTEALKRCQSGGCQVVDVVAYAWVAVVSGRGDGSAVAVSSTLLT